MALIDIIGKALIAGTLLVPTTSPAQDTSQVSNQESAENSEKPKMPEVIENDNQTIRGYKIGKDWNYSTKPGQIKWSYSKDAGWMIVDDSTGVIKVNRAIIRKTNGTIDRFVEFSNKPGNAHTAYYPVYQCKDCGKHHPEKNRTSAKGLYKSKAGVMFAWGN